MSAPDIDGIVAHYVKLRDQRAEIEAECKERTADIVRDMERIEAALMKHMRTVGAESIRTGHGTAYISTVTSAKVSDWPALLEHIRRHGAWELLERRVNKSAFDAAVDAGAEPPGVESSAFARVNFRRS